MNLLIRNDHSGTQCKKDVSQCCEIEKKGHINSVKLLLKHCETLCSILNDFIKISNS